MIFERTLIYALYNPSSIYFRMVLHQNNSFATHRFAVRLKASGGFSVIHRFQVLSLGFVGSLEEPPVRYRAMYIYIYTDMYVCIYIYYIYVWYLYLCFYT